MRSRGNAMKNIRAIAALGAVIAVAVPTAVLSQRDSDEEAAAGYRVTLDKYCVVCHNGTPRWFTHLVAKK